MFYSDTLKELRKDALERIDALNAELNKIVKDVLFASRSKIEERLPNAQRKVEECRLRCGILDEHYGLVCHRDIQNLDNEKAYRVIYSALETETKEYSDELFQSCSRLKYFYDNLDAVAGKTKVGFDYFENKFNEEYRENTRLWTASQGLCHDIKKLNQEVNDARVKEFGDEPEA